MRWLGIGLLWTAATLAAAAESGVDGDLASQAWGQDMFMAGGTVTVNQPVSGDLIVSGGSIDLDAPVAGDTLAIGGKLRLGADIARSVHAAAGQLSFNAKVGRNARVAGGQVELGPKAEIGGNLAVAGGQVRLYGTVHGQVQSVGGQLLIDGPVDGDVLALHAKLELGPRARVAGKLRYRSEEPLLRDPAAQVLGGIERLPSPVAPTGSHPEPGHTASSSGKLGVLWMLGLIVLAGALLAALPGFSARLARTLRERPGASLLLGFAWLVCLPVAVVLLFITLVGIPLGLFALAAYAALLPLALAITGIGIGDWLLHRWLPQRADALSVRIGAAAAVLVMLTLVGWVPGLGAAVVVLSLVAGLGTLLLQAAPRPRGEVAAPAPGLPS
jgi:hypothetical protein